MVRTLEALSRSEASVKPALSARLYAEIQDQEWHCYRGANDDQLSALAEQFFNYHAYVKSELMNHYNQPPAVTIGFDFMGDPLRGALYSNGSIIVWRDTIELWIDPDTIRRFQYPTPVTQGTE